MASKIEEAEPGERGTAGVDAEALAGALGRHDDARSSSSRAFAGGVLTLCTLCSLACGGGSGSAQATDTGGAGDAAVAAAPATFTEIYATILQPTCSVCHTPGGIGAFQDFSSQSSAYAALVGVKASGPSCGSSGETRVVAGNASQSLLFQKISEANPPCGSPMPLGGPPLSSAQTTLIEGWINAGALDD
jgi:hypothetical protein